MAEQPPVESSMTAIWHALPAPAPVSCEDVGGPAQPMTADWDYAEAVSRAVEEAILGKPGIIPPAPLSCDLTGDRLACAILRAWARQPWEPVHRAALLDRMEELGKSEEEKAWVSQLSAEALDFFRDMRQNNTRTFLHKHLKAWRTTTLRYHFGDFESKHSAARRPADTAGSAQTPAG
jgi:hypothetical protein